MTTPLPLVYTPPRAKGSSSIGRAAVSKTARCVFESRLPCFSRAPVRTAFLFYGTGCDLPMTVYRNRNELTHRRLGKRRSALERFITVCALLLCALTVCAALSACRTMFAAGTVSAAETETSGESAGDAVQAATAGPAATDANQSGSNNSGKYFVNKTHIIISCLVAFALAVLIAVLQAKKRFK